MTTADTMHRLYHDLLDAWNRRDAHGFARLFAADGSLVGFDGSQVAAAEIEAHLGPIFASHPTAAYVGQVREVREIGEVGGAGVGAALLRAIVGMVPPGQSTVNPAVNAVQSLLAERAGDAWRVVHFQTTPAQYHGRPDLAEQHTAEIQRLVDGPRPG